ncbi:Hyaluronidase [Aphelenchoides fujianensis]|nr:Hyaluronidase [Aphelenchoides fujianensis]
MFGGTFLPVSHFLLVSNLVAARRPFEIYWNVPSDSCKQLHPEAYGITTNTGDHFAGDKLVIFYSFGKLPYCNEKLQMGLNTEASECTNAVNGGVPQAANFTAHFAQIKADIDERMPNASFDGLAVVDYEAWRPVWELNHSSRRVYQKLSMELVEKKCPGCSKEEIARRAQEELEEASKTFLLKTLEYAKKLRPNAKWAFWEYPLCDNTVGYANYSLHCTDMYLRANRKLMYLYEASDVLLPKIYFYGSPIEKGRRQFHVHGELHQAFEINKALRPHPKLVYAYAKFEYAIKWNDSSQPVRELFYSKEDLCTTLKYASELGVDGVVLWSTSARMGARCDLLEGYLKNFLGPAARIVLQEAERCATEKCGGEGRCVLDDPRPPAKCELGQRRPMHCVPY